MSSRGPVAELKAVALSFMGVDGGAAAAHYFCQFDRVDWRIVVVNHINFLIC
jgi:hypothetical protein